MSKSEYLSMPDPCQHITRLDIIKARLHNQPEPTCTECSGEYELRHVITGLSPDDHEAWLAELDAQKEKDYIDVEAAKEIINDLRG